MFLKQCYSQLQDDGRLWDYGRRTIGDKTLYQELPCIHTDTHIYVHTRRSKKVVFASIYSNEMSTVSALLLSFNESVSISPSFFSS